MYRKDSRFQTHGLPTYSDSNKVKRVYSNENRPDMIKTPIRMIKHGTVLLEAFLVLESGNGSSLFLFNSSRLLLHLSVEQVNKQSIIDSVRFIS